MKLRPAGVVCGSFSIFTPCSGASAAALHLIGGDGNLCLHIHAVLRCFSSPGVATPSDGALRRHPRTLTALRTQSGIEDAGGDRGIVCVVRMGGCGRSVVPLI